MAELLKGAAVAAAINERTAASAASLREKGIIPTLAIFRVGEREDDLSYERGAVKRCQSVGVDVKNVVLPADIDEKTFFDTLENLNRDNTVHGILMFRPLPRHLDSEKARKSIAAEKDVDGCTDMSLAGVFTGTDMGFPPCTAQAAMEILHYYGIELKGKSVAVIGRSLVIGRPVAMMLMHENATVTICHTKTVNVPEITRKADIIVSAAGVPEMVDSKYLSDGQIVIDVGISWNEEKGKLCGDVKAENAQNCVSAFTPVPGGVGAVTTAVLVSHVVCAAERLSEQI